MNEILNEIKPELPVTNSAPSALYKWVVLGVIILVICLIIYFTFFAKSADAKQTVAPVQEKKSNAEEFDVKKKEVEKEIFGTAPKKENKEEVKKIAEDFKEDSSSEEAEN